MSNTDMRLMVSIFGKANRVGNFPDPEELITEYDYDLEVICRMLKTLGLVEKARSKFGYKPTDRLIDIIVGRMVSPSTAISRLDQDYFELLWLSVTHQFGQEQNVPEDHKPMVALTDCQESDQKDEDENDENEDGKDEDDEGEIDEDELVGVICDRDAKELCEQVFVSLGLLKQHGKGHITTRLLTNLLLENSFEHLLKANNLN